MCFSDFTINHCFLNYVLCILCIKTIFGNTKVGLRIRYMNCKFYELLLDFMMVSIVTIYIVSNRLLQIWSASFSFLLTRKIVWRKKSSHEIFIRLHFSWHSNALLFVLYLQISHIIGLLSNYIRVITTLWWKLNKMIYHLW